MVDKSLEIETIFMQALELPTAEERVAFLDRQCGDDTELRRQVDSLLAANVEMGSFLDQTLPPDQSFAVSAVLPDKIGNYQVLEQIGAGGMGEVYVAEQRAPVKRRVALKIIRAGMDSRDVLARFEAERQALAMMDHPNIAKVLDAGTTTSGRPYFVMEWVRGASLTEFCDENQLNSRQRLALFVDVCNAIQHAHQKGVIHRDIKPGNVMVTPNDGSPVVKVIDFGVAKAVNQQLTDKTVYTQFAAMIGTPLYMSPEQAGMSSLDVDTRTDVYSLGVLLYELLTGETPFSKARLREAEFDEMRRIIREEEPPKPSTKVSTLGETATAISVQRKSDPRRLKQLLQGDLDWIVMKALEKDRTRRYDTANGLAMDVMRFLRNEPVLASPPSNVYRIRKFVARNRVVVAAISLIALSLIVGLVGTGAGLTWALAEKREAEFERNRAVKSEEAERAARRSADLATGLARDAEANANAKATEAEARFQLAIQAIDKYYSGVSEDLLLKEPRFQQLRHGLLQSAIDFYRKLQKDLEGSSEPSQQLALATSQSKLGEILTSVGALEEARATFQRSRKIHAQLVVAGFETDETRFELAELLSLYAFLMVELAELETAEILFAEAIQVIAEVSPDTNGYDRYLHSLANSQAGLANVYSDAGKLDEAKATFRDAIESSQASLDLIPGDTDYLNRMASSYGNLAILHLNAGEPEKARELFLKDVDIMERLVVAQPKNQEFINNLARAHNNIGHAIGRLGDELLAQKHYEKSMEYSQRLVAEFPNVIEFVGVMANTHASLGNAQKKNRQLNRARVSYQSAIDLLTGLQGLEHRRYLASAHYNLAKLEQQTGNANAARSSFEASWKLLDALVTERPDSGRVIASYAATSNDFALFLSGLGDFKESTRHLEKAVELRKQLLGQNPEDISQRIWLGGAYCNLASNRARQHDFKAATDSYQNALEELTWLQENLDKEDSLYQTVILFKRNSFFGLGRTHEMAGEIKLAAENWMNAYDLDNGPDKPYLLAKSVVCRLQCTDTTVHELAQSMVQDEKFSADMKHEMLLMCLDLGKGKTPVLNFAETVAQGIAMSHTQGPKAYRFWQTCSKVQATLGKLPEAITSLEKAIETAEDHATKAEKKALQTKLQHLQQQVEELENQSPDE